MNHPFVVSGPLVRVVRIAARVICIAFNDQFPDSFRGFLFYVYRAAGGKGERDFFTGSNNNGEGVWRRHCRLLGGQEGQTRLIHAFSRVWPFGLPPFADGIVRSAGCGTSEASHVCRSIVGVQAAGSGGREAQPSGRQYWRYMCADPICEWQTYRQEPQICLGVVTDGLHHHLRFLPRTLPCRHASAQRIRFLRRQDRAQFRC